MSTTERTMEDRLNDERDTVYLAELFEEVNALIRSRRKANKELADKLMVMFSKRDESSYNLLRDYLQSVYHPAVKFDLPEEVPPFDNSAYGAQEMAPTTLAMALKRVPWFVKGTKSYTEQRVKREHQFIQTLESLHAKDSQLYLGILLKQFPIDAYPKLNIDYFFSLFPQFFVGVDVEEVSKQEKAAAKKSNTKKATSSSKKK